MQAFSIGGGTRVLSADEATRSRARDRTAVCVRRPGLGAAVRVVLSLAASGCIPSHSPDDLLPKHQPDQGTPSKTSESGHVLRVETVPLLKRDELGRPYVAVPLGDEHVGSWFVHSGNLIWDSHDGLSPWAADMLRATDGERAAIKQAVRRAWEGMGALERFCRLRWSPGSVVITVPSWDEWKLRQGMDALSSDLLRAAKAILKGERAEILGWFSPRDVRYVTLPGLEWIVNHVEGIGRFSILMDAKKAPHDGIHVHVSEAYGDGRTGTCLWRWFNYDRVPWPGVGVRLGVADLMESAWKEKPAPLQLRHQVTLDSFPIGAVDGRGERYLFIPWLWGWQRLSDTTMLLETWETLNPRMKKLLRMDEAEEKALVATVVRSEKELGQLASEYAHVEERNSTKVVVVIEAEAKPAVDAAIERAIGEVAAEHGRDIADMLRTGYTWSFLPDSLRYLAAPGRQPVRISLQSEGGEITLHVERKGQGSSTGHLRSGKNVPDFMWRFCPPEFADIAPPGVRPGNETKGARAKGLLGTYTN